MNQHRPSDPTPDSALDREIEALFAVEPPADFVNKVRTRVAQVPAPSVWRFRPVFVAAAASFAAVLLLLVFWPNVSDRPEPAVTATVVKEAALPEVPAAETGRVSPIVRSSGGSKARTTTPELLISAGEASAIRRLLNGQVGPLPASVSDSLRTSEGIVELAVPQIAIKPVEVPKPITIEPMDTPPAITEEGV